MKMDINTCYENVLGQLVAENKIKNISQNLLSLSHNDERVLYVYDLLENLSAFPTVLKVSKSKDVSTQYRNLGNKFYQKSDILSNYKAWQYYNLSLLYAPIGTEEYSLALSNRSAVFMSMKKYKECIKDIGDVFATNYPEKLKDKLKKRKLMCEDRVIQQLTIEKNEINLEFEKSLSLQNPTDSRYTCASSKLEVVFSKEMGRHVVAKQDIKVGEILVQEDPYFVLLLQSQYLLSCSYCISRKLNLIPCPTCCYVLYCSEDCKKKAWEEYHSTECCLMATVLSMDFTKLEWLGLRTVIKARTDHNDWKSLFETIEKAEENADTELRGLVKVNDDWVYDSKYYTSIHMLESNIDKRNVSDIFQKCVTAAILLRLLVEETKLLESDEPDEKEKIKKCVAGLLLHHTMTSATNMHGISATMQSEDGNYVEELNIASAPYAFHSLLNHSCAPNVVRYNRLGTGRMLLFALRPIKKGMQLFDNYGSHHALEEYTSRQKSLEHQYKFKCICEACVNKWPMYFNLPLARNLPPQLTKQNDELLDSNNIEKLQKGDVVTARKLFKPLCELAELLEPYGPCKEVGDCQETLKQCLQILGGLVPFGCSFLVEWIAKRPSS